MSPNYKVGDFALVQGQIVEILDVRIGMNREFDWYRYKVKLENDTITVWVNEVDIQKIDKQDAPKVLYGRRKSG